MGSTPPTAAAVEMVNGKTTYNAGDTLTFKVADGSGTDAQDGALPDSAYKRTVVFHHNKHPHPFVDNIDGPRARPCIVAAIALAQRRFCPGVGNRGRDQP